MELQLVTFEQAKALKELGFPDDTSYQACPYCYFGKDLIDIQNNNVSALNPKWREVKDEDICSAPTLELAAKWLRDNKNISICPNIEPCNNFIMYSIKSIYDTNGNYVGSLGDKLFESYEEALSVGIDKVIEILKRQ